MLAVACSKNEEVEVNFGNGAAPFVFDLDQLVRADQDVQGRAVHGCAETSPDLCGLPVTGVLIQIDALACSNSMPIGS